MKAIRFGTGLLALAMALAQGAMAQEGDANFYAGKTITITVGSSAGGGYDLYGRLLSRFMGRHIAGNPTFIVANMPGAGGNVAAAHIANVAPKDGTAIGAIFMGTVVDPLFSAQGARKTHDPVKFNYIGNANKDVYVCLVRTDAQVKTFQDLMEKELVVGASAGGASTRDFPLLLKNILGAKFRIVAGYPGTRQIKAAIEKGEVQGGCGQSWSSMAATYPHWFKDNLVKVLVQEDPEGYPELNAKGIPLVRSLAKNEEQRKIFDLVYSQTVFGRPYVVAAEVPAGRVAILRKAFSAAMSDPGLKAEAAKMQVDVDFTPGEELQKKIVEVYATPADIVEKARKAFEGQ